MMSAYFVAKLPTIEHTGKEWVPKQYAANMSTQMSHILKALPSGVIILTSDGMVSEANPAAIALLGEPLKQQKWLNIIKRSFAPQDDDGHEVSLKNGRRIKLEMTPLMPEGGQLIVLTDLTQTRLLQKNIAHLQRLSALGEMVAKLAHQIRTPLSAALLYAVNLGNSKLEHKAKTKFHNKLVDRLNELEHSVNDMLLMAKSQQNLNGEAVTVKALFQQVIANCEAMAMRYACELMINIQSNEKIFANITSVSSGITNLVVNAIEAKANKVCLKATIDDGYLCLQIIDNGKGIKFENQSKILEPFFTTKSHGTGLGLAVVQSIVTNHKGSMTFSTEENKGCCFSIFFPIYKSANY